MSNFIIANDGPTDMEITYLELVVTIASSAFLPHSCAHYAYLTSFDCSATRHMCYCH